MLVFIIGCFFGAFIGLFAGGIVAGGSERIVYVSNMSTEIDDNLNDLNNFGLRPSL